MAIGIVPPGGTAAPGTSKMVNLGPGAEAAEAMPGWPRARKRPRQVVSGKPASKSALELFTLDRTFVWAERCAVPKGFALARYQRCPRCPRINKSICKEIVSVRA